MITDKSVIGFTLGVCSVEYQPTVHHGSRTTAQGPGRAFRWLELVDGGSE